MPRKKAISKLLKKREAVSETIRTEPVLPQAEDYEQTLADREHLEARKRERRYRRQTAVRRVVSIALIVCCLYLSFLIYGAVNTEFVYDADGSIVPRAMTVQRIEALENYRQLAIQYRQARYLYEQVLVLDYRIAAGIEDPLTVAPEYEKMLDSIESLAIQLGAVELASEYTQTLSMLTTWVSEDIAVYCQNMSRAISQNNEQYAANALEYKTRVYQDFSVITQNILVLSQNVEGADTQDIAAWSPESYIEDTIGAYGGS